MKRVDYLTKNNCWGCTVCVNICTQEAITMLPDKEGFLYPHVDEDKCIYGEDCYNSCPSVIKSNNNSTIFVNEAYACKILDDEVRHISSSGGAFSAIAKKIFEQNGFVAGVAYSDDFREAKHSMIDSWDRLDSLRRSKLLQSNKGNIFTEVENKLENENSVLFTGTPCEVTALKSYLGKEYDNLVTCDLVCGCVASPKVYNKYISYLEKKYNSKVSFVNFKDKTNGWQGRRINIQFENQEIYTNETSDDPYIVSFHSRFNIRPSCFNCKNRHLDRNSDITLGDFWGIKFYNSSLDDNKGTSFVMVNSEKGKKLVQSLSDTMDIRHLDIDIKAYSNKYNYCLIKSPTGAKQTKRENFYRDLDILDFDELFDVHLRDIWLERKRRKEEYLKKLEQE